jgi:hypothetical protein
MASENEIIVQIVGDISGLRTSVAEANTTISSLQGQVSGLTSKLDTMTPAVTGAAAGVSRLENTAAMVTGKIVGMEAGVGMLGGQFGRLGAAAGMAGPLLAAAIPVALVVGAIELYGRWQEKVLAVTEDTIALNKFIGTSNDRLTEERERLVGLTQGPLAEYRMQLADLAGEYPRMESGISVFNKQLEDQYDYVIKIVLGLQLMAQYATGGAPGIAAGLASYTSPAQAKQAIADIESQVRSNDDLVAAGGKALALQRDYQNAVRTTTGAQQELNYMALDYVNNYLEQLKRRYQDYISTAMAKGTELHSREVSDASELARIVLEGKDQHARAIKEEIGQQARLAEVQATPAVPRREQAPADIGAAKNAAIARADAEESAEKGLVETLRTDMEARYAAEVKAAGGNADKVKEIKAKEANEEQALDDRLTVSHNNAVNARAEAEHKAAVESEALAFHEAEFQQELARKTAQEAIRSDEESLREKTKAQQRSLEDIELERKARTAGIGTGPVTTSINIESLRRELAQAKAIHGQILSEQDGYEVEMVAKKMKMAATDTTTDLGKKAYLDLQEQLDGTKRKYDAVTDSIAKLIQKQKELGTELKLQTSSWQQDTVKAAQASINAFNNAFTQWVVHGGSAYKILQATETAFVELMIQSSLKMVERRIAAFLMERVARAAADRAGVEMKKASDAEMGLGDAKMAAKGAYSAVSPIPIVGPILAPIAAAAAFVAVMAFEKGGIHPDTGLYMGHAQEMTLPAHLSTFIQKAAAHEGGVGGGTNIFGGIHYAPVISEPFNPQKHGTEMVSFLKSKISRMGVA